MSASEVYFNYNIQKILYVLTEYNPAGKRINSRCEDKRAAVYNFFRYVEGLYSHVITFCLKIV
ncbi:MAG: hypothetical protein A2008_05665 [Candidatus Wallbacteria bacterium GWC2_49_35]|uniref:Uncharacterized protein n=1 Tax=Candidatus Wallbacteria bacterium GWC2_49_35 TaxID=1817813 RepID=A0A1F7WUA1_9BACT|nr:MAG: hypothetical protein A2008_05665 [Candidatus Wallbacteria bacterium GWC2_49_35]